MDDDVVFVKCEQIVRSEKNPKPMKLLPCQEKQKESKRNVSVLRPKAATESLVITREMSQEPQHIKFVVNINASMCHHKRKKRKRTSCMCKNVSKDSSDHSDVEFVPLEPKKQKLREAIKTPQSPNRTVPTCMRKNCVAVDIKKKTQTDTRKRRVEKNNNDRNCSNSMSRERPREAKPREAKPREEKSREARPREARLSEARSREARSREARPWEARSREARSREARPWEARSREARSREARPREARPKEARSREARSRVARPRKARPREASPREARPREARSREARPREASPRERRSKRYENNSRACTHDFLRSRSSRVQRDRKEDKKRSPMSLSLSSISNESFEESNISYDDVSSDYFIIHSEDELDTLIKRTKEREREMVIRQWSNRERGFEPIRSPLPFAEVLHASTPNNFDDNATVFSSEMDVTIHSLSTVVLDRNVNIEVYSPTMSPNELLYPRICLSDDDTIQLHASPVYELEDRMKMKTETKYEYKTHECPTQVCKVIPDETKEKRTKNIKKEDMKTYTNQERVLGKERSEPAEQKVYEDVRLRRNEKQKTF